jgi:prepilin-type processing-associated H-X9-DG protein
LPAPQSFCTLVDLGLLFKKAPLIGMAVGAKYAQLLARGSLGLALSCEGRVARLELRWTMQDAGARQPRRDSEAGGGEIADAGEGQDMEAVAVVAGLMTESLVKARAEAKRTVSMANMRAFGQALYLYAQAGGRRDFPPSLKEAGAMLGDEQAYLRMLTSPYDGEGPASVDEIDRKAYLIYRPGLSPSSNPEEIVMAERSPGDRGGANFLFVDGHVEFIAEPRASQIIRLIEQGAESVRK